MFLGLRPRWLGSESRITGWWCVCKLCVVNVLNCLELKFTHLAGRANSPSRRTNWANLIGSKFWYCLWTVFFLLGWILGLLPWLLSTRLSHMLNANRMRLFVKRLLCKSSNVKINWSNWQTWSRRTRWELLSFGASVSNVYGLKFYNVFFQRARGRDDFDDFDDAMEMAPIPKEF